MADILLSLICVAVVGFGVFDTIVVTVWLIVVCTVLCTYAVLDIYVVSSVYMS